MVVLGGEAGIGKSRMSDALAERLKGIPHRSRGLYCSPFYRNSALYPVIEALRAELGLSGQVPGAEKLDRIEALLTAAGLPVDEESVPLWASLLSVPLDGRYPESRMPAPQRKAASLQAVVEWLVRLAAREPLVLTVHDLHWVDPSTLELLDLLVGLERPAKLLVVLSHRPDFEPPWPESPRLKRLTLEKLEPAQVATMIRSLAGGRRLPPELVAQLVARTDGVPLFVEELTKTVLESDLLREGPSGYDLAEPLPSFDIPSTLQSSLLARLDRLTSAKDVAQLGAVVGREVSRELLARLSPLDEKTLDHELDRLVEADLLGRRRGALGEVLVFRHALIQEAAYKSLLRADRQVWHARIGEILEETYGAEDGPRAELLAHHYTLGGRPDEAVRYWHEAGRRALERSANVEAARHIRAGLELVSSLAQEEARPRRELELQTVLGSALMAVKGYAASEVVAVFARARELAESVGEARQTLGVLMGLVRLHGARADLVRARAHGGELLHLATQSGAEEFVLEAHRFLGAISFHMGALESARQHLDEALALFDPAKHGDHAYLYNEDTEVFCLDNLAWTLWHLGFPAEALERNRAALRRARELDHPFTLAHALSFRAVLLQFHRAAEAALAAAEEVIFTSEQHGFPHRLAMGLFVKGWARAELGDRDEGIALMDEGLERWRASGAEILRPCFLTYLAGTFLADGQTELALELLDKAEVLGGVTGERFHEADLYRIRGEALWRLGGDGRREEARSSLRAALAVARSQGARLLELRTATSLARLLAGTGCPEQGRAPLAEALDRFGAGFDGADYRDARSLMEELAPAGGRSPAMCGGKAESRPFSIVARLLELRPWELGESRRAVPSRTLSLTPGGSPRRRSRPPGPIPPTARGRWRRASTCSWPAAWWSWPDDVCRLSERGRTEAARALEKEADRRFEELLLACESSAAYGRLCQRVHGLDLRQLDVLDSAQLDYLVACLAPEGDRPHRILDLGCGIGRLGEHLAAATGAFVLADRPRAGAIRRARERAREDAAARPAGRLPARRPARTSRASTGGGGPVGRRGRGRLALLRSTISTPRWPRMARACWRPAARPRSSRASSCPRGPGGLERGGGRGAHGPEHPDGRCPGAPWLQPSRSGTSAAPSTPSGTGSAWRPWPSAGLSKARGAASSAGIRLEEAERTIEWVEAGRVRRYFYRAQTADRSRASERRLRLRIGVDRRSEALGRSDALEHLPEAGGETGSGEEVAPGRLALDLRRGAAPEGSGDLRESLPAGRPLAAPAPVAAVDLARGGGRGQRVADERRGGERPREGPGRDQAALGRQEGEEPLVGRPRRTVSVRRPIEPQAPGERGEGLAGAAMVRQRRGGQGRDPRFRQELALRQR